MADVERELDRLYEAPLDEFTARRNELAAELRKEGERDAADQVKGLRKPTLVAWVVNQLARGNRPHIDALLEASARLRQAQAEVLGGGDKEEFRAATAAQREAIRALGQAARQLLAEAGRPAGSIVDRVSATLTAAVTDAEGRRDLERGRLTSELMPPGFEVYDDMDVPQQRRPREQKAARERDDRTTQKELELKRRELRAELRELEREARVAERAADRAEADARRARAAADEARDRADSAEGRLDELRGL